MRVGIHPQAIKGMWLEGFALDTHAISSEFVGYDGYGRPEFQTTRSGLGELVYKLKYRADAASIDSIADTAVAFLANRWRIALDLIIPVPPSNMGRKRQPVLEVAKRISVKSGILLCNSCIQKIRPTQQLKNVYDYEERASILHGAFAVNKRLTAGKKLLLSDDLFRSGATMNTIVGTLIQEGDAKTVYALALTRTRSSL
jgi:predicted amidophosphoribosyltransferase